MNNKNQENPFLLFMSCTHMFSICTSAYASELASLAPIYKTAMRLKQQKKKHQKPDLLDKNMNQ